MLGIPFSTIDIEIVDTFLNNNIEFKIAEKNFFRLKISGECKVFITENLRD